MNPSFWFNIFLSQCEAKFQLTSFPSPTLPSRWQNYSISNICTLKKNFIIYILSTTQQGFRTVRISTQSISPNSADRFNLASIIMLNRWQQQKQRIWATYKRWLGHSFCISHGEKIWSLPLHQNLPHTSIAVFLLINLVFLYHIKVRRAVHQSFSIFIFWNTPTTKQNPTRTSSIQRLEI